MIASSNCVRLSEYIAGLMRVEAPVILTAWRRTDNRPAYAGFIFMAVAAVGLPDEFRLPGCTATVFMDLLRWKIIVPSCSMAHIW